MKKAIKAIYAKLRKQNKVNSIHAGLNSVVLDLHALRRADDEETRQDIMTRAIKSIGTAKQAMADLGLEYQI